MLWAIRRNCWPPKSPTTLESDPGIKVQFRQRSRFWSPVYLDFAERRPKITLAQPLYQADQQLRGAIENWPVVAAYMLARLRTENAHFGGDPVLERAITALSAIQPSLPGSPGEQGPPVIPVKLR
ncbi:MAG: hypothetical protein HC936_13950, partial [Leptolyngbyaceae cyanobacterium SU_3_3]|nr:hypothetical protein [Leptolyngbyaceae cyanobacterium SU_3_3]